jgi:hypothetical protein
MHSAITVVGYVLFQARKKAPEFPAPRGSRDAVKRVRLIRNKLTCFPRWGLHPNHGGR